MAGATGLSEAPTMEMSRRSFEIVHETDAALVRRARTGEPTAFGLLYLRHHEAAWRVANAVTAFSPTADRVVVEAFTRALVGSPRRPGPDAVLRPDLLRHVREVALEWAGDQRRIASRAKSSPPPGGATDELVLADVEPVVAAAFRALEEPARTALWLTEIEALTPTEVGRVMDLPAERAAALGVEARGQLSQALLGLFAEERSSACAAPRDRRSSGSAVTSEPGRGCEPPGCPLCRMRQAEAADPIATLRSVLPAAPLLGGPCQRRWLGRTGGPRRRADRPRRAAVVVTAMVVAVLLFSCSRRPP